MAKRVSLGIELRENTYVWTCNVVSAGVSGSGVPTGTRAALKPALPGSLVLYSTLKQMRSVPRIDKELCNWFSVLVSSPSWRSTLYIHFGAVCLKITLWAVRSSIIVEKSEPGNWVRLILVINKCIRPSRIGSWCGRLSAAVKSSVAQICAVTGGSPPQNLQEV